MTFPDFPLDPATSQPDITSNYATGVVFNASAWSFVIPQTPSTPSANLAPIPNGAKIQCATD